MANNDPRPTPPLDTPAQHAVAEHLRLLTSGDLDRWAELFATDCVFAFPSLRQG